MKIRPAALISLFAVFIVSAFMTLIASAADVSGISVSKTQLTPGESFTVTLTVPASPDNADTASVKVKFDEDTFEVISWQPAVPGTKAKGGNDYLALAAANSGRAIDLRNGLVLSAKMRVRTDAPFGVHTFSLSESSFSYYEDDGITSHELWDPYITSATVIVSAGSPGNDTPDPGNDDPEPAVTGIKGGGLTVSKQQLYAGDTFRADITIPSGIASADTMLIKATFDPDIFEVISWKPDKNVFTSNAGTGFFALTTLSTDAGINISGGLSFSAEMRVKSDAKAGKYTFTLTDHSVSLFNSSGTAHSELWTPTQITADVVVSVKEEQPRTLPVSGGGISAARSQLTPGDMLTVYVTVPPINAAARDAWVRIEYDPTVFGSASWSSGITGGIPNTGTDYLSLSVSDSREGIDLSRGLTLSARFMVRSTSPLKSTDLRLTAANLSYMKENGYDYQELWTPTTLLAHITVAAPNITPAGMITATTARVSPAVTGAAVTTAPESDDETTLPAITSESADEVTEDEEVFDPAPQDDEYDDLPEVDPYAEPDNDDYGEGEGFELSDDELFNDDDEPLYPEETTSVNRPEISLEQDLDGLTDGNIRIQTKYDFFDEDTVIIISGSEYADMCAAEALNAPGMHEDLFYAFDISVYSISSGAYIHYLNGGYIDFSIPVPKELAGVSRFIKVYHIEGGYPEPADSSIIYEDGQEKVHFRADSFSPYMFAVYTGNVEAAGDVSGAVDIAPDIKTRPRGILNPATGVAAAITLPAVMTGCVFLARKVRKRRKRSKNNNIQ